MFLPTASNPGLITPSKEEAPCASTERYRAVFSGLVTLTLVMELTGCLVYNAEAKVNCRYF
jgi:hypothetical protein